MASEKLNAIDACKSCIDTHKSFVLQGGAGSGKTESLKELLLYIKKEHPTARVVCITHTNAAVDEIVSRVGEQYAVSTIHSFVHKLIGNHKKNIKTVIGELFFLPLMIRIEQTEGISEAEYNKTEHDKYKKAYENYARTLYAVCKEKCEKVTGKREYDKAPNVYNSELNNKIQTLNDKISSIIDEIDYVTIHYNETSFNSLKDLSYGHDGLLQIFHLMFRRFPLLGKIIADKYDYVFIDEYQDTQGNVLHDFLTLPQKYDLTVGLFGDVMQSIYDDGVGSVQEYVNNSVLEAIPKSDNYRCSYEVVDIINLLRLDNITQEVVMKKRGDGQLENEDNRHGLVKILYSVVDKKPTSFSSPEDKEAFQMIINNLILEAKKMTQDAKILVLTNKAIAGKNGFGYLYKVFDDRYSNVNDRIESYLRSIQALDVSVLCRLYLRKDYNELIRRVRKGGYVIHTGADKTRLHDIINEIINNKEFSIQEAIKFAVYNKLIKQTETYINIKERNEQFLEELKNDELYQVFKPLYLNGKNTFSRISGSISIGSQEEFNHYESLQKREQFISEMFSSKLKFVEVLNYAKYLDEETEYITMHKTKGTSISSVIVVMEEFFWNEYDFSLLYMPTEESKMEKKNNSQKLIYVACSRAKNNLICVKVLPIDEVEPFKKLFPKAELVVQMPNLELEDKAIMEDRGEC